MEGMLILFDRVGEPVQARRITCQSDVHKALNYWKKIYGKGYENTTYKIKLDFEENKPLQKSKFKKWYLPKDFNKRKGRRIYYPDMDGNK